MDGLDVTCVGVNSYTPVLNNLSITSFSFVATISRRIGTPMRFAIYPDKILPKLPVGTTKSTSSPTCAAACRYPEKKYGTWEEILPQFIEFTAPSFENSSSCFNSLTKSWQSSKRPRTLTLKMLLPESAEQGINGLVELLGAEGVLGPFGGQGPAGAEQSGAAGAEEHGGGERVLEEEPAGKVSHGVLRKIKKHGRGILADNNMSL